MGKDCAVVVNSMSNVLEDLKKNATNPAGTGLYLIKYPHIHEQRA